MTEYRKDGFVLSDDSKLVDIGVVHDFLESAYWSCGIPMEVVERSIQNSICYCVFDHETQVAFARIVSDLATFAYLADVFVIESHRGKGISKWLVSTIMSDSRYQMIRRFMLVTRDAHDLYRQFGFHETPMPERIMEITRPGIYRLAREHSKTLD